MNSTRKHKKYDITAMDNLIATVSPYELIGLGEGSHGSYKNAMFRTNTIKQLIKKHNVREVFLEDDVFSMLKIGKNGQSRLHANMNQLQYCFDNIAMRTLYTWILQFNKDHPKDTVKILGADIQLFQLEDNSDKSPLGALYRKWGKYNIDHATTKDSHSPRDKAMSEMIKAQHTPGVKAVLIFHNDHLNKSKIHYNMGFLINKAYPEKYIVVANTFTKGTYYGFFNGWTEGLKNEGVDITVNVKDPFYKGDSPKFYYPPPVNYIWEGHGGADPRDHMKYFFRKSSHGFDAILFINNEEPLRPYKTNQMFSE
jgi:erythromycin esterase-like protein